jgi:hypothetical protein
MRVNPQCDADAPQEIRGSHVRASSRVHPARVAEIMTTTMRRNIARVIRRGDGIRST